jgi:predicted kinase
MFFPVSVVTTGFFPNHDGLNPRPFFVWRRPGRPSPEWKGMFPDVVPDESTAWAQAMRQCPQNPIFHAEGDVWAHTVMVYEEMHKDPAFQALPAAERYVMQWAALLHDVGKPACTQADGSQRGHARVGSILARQLLWKAGLAPHLREQICSLVRYHMIPHRLTDFWDYQRRVLAMTATTPSHLLSILVRADARGRICPDLDKLLYQCDILDQLILENPPHFPDDHSRVHFFRKGVDPKRQVYDDTRCTVTLLSGLPGSGKSTWVPQNSQGRPVICLDEIREELSVAPSDSQAPVIEAAREQARQYLRAGQDFLWDATNLSEELRSRCLDLFFDYSARTHIVYQEAPFQEWKNRAVDIPGAALERMWRRWELPTCLEAHQVCYPW